MELFFLNSFMFPVFRHTRFSSNGIQPEVFLQHFPVFIVRLEHVSPRQHYLTSNEMSSDVMRTNH